MDEDDILIASEPDVPHLRLSASQLSTYEQCARKWKFRYVDKIYGDPTAAMVV